MEDEDFEVESEKDGEDAQEDKEGEEGEEGEEGAEGEEVEEDKEDEELDEGEEEEEIGRAEEEEELEESDPASTMGGGVETKGRAPGGIAGLLEETAFNEVLDGGVMTTETFSVELLVMEPLPPSIDGKATINEEEETEDDEEDEEDDDESGKRK